MTKNPLHIAIIGAGFSGTAVTAAIDCIAKKPVHVTLIERSGCFGTGKAYQTPYTHHLLNVRADEMSIYPHDPHHFVNWIKQQALIEIPFVQHLLLEKQFLPRRWYGEYLQSVLKKIQMNKSGKVILDLQVQEIVGADFVNGKALLQLQDGGVIKADKVVLALGHHHFSHFPFPVSPEEHTKRDTRKVNCIADPWHYRAVGDIQKKGTVFIVGTGLSMIDVVLTLYYQHHQGKIIALSRHGLLPLPHPYIDMPFVFENTMPQKLNPLLKYLRRVHSEESNKGKDWCSVIQGLRRHTINLWTQVSIEDKKRFMRHLLSYWNIHRHRVHEQISGLLSDLMAKKQLEILAGHVLGVKGNQVTFRKRLSKEIQHLKIDYLVNCMGPQLRTTHSSSPLISSLLTKKIAIPDPLQMGFKVMDDGALVNDRNQASQVWYTLGSLTKGQYFECTAVPDIREQAFRLVKNLFIK